jgi:hypothetical protein
MVLRRTLCRFSNNRRTSGAPEGGDRALRMDARVKQDLVRIDVPEPCHDGLVRQQGLDAAASAPQALLEGREIQSEGVGPKSLRSTKRSG